MKRELIDKNKLWERCLTEKEETGHFSLETLRVEIGKQQVFQPETSLLYEILEKLQKEYEEQCEYEVVNWMNECLSGGLYRAIRIIKEVIKKQNG